MTGSTEKNVVAKRFKTVCYVVAFASMLIAFSADAGGFGNISGAMAGKFDSYGSDQGRRNEKQLNEVLVELSEYLNKHMPQVIDANTRLDHVGVGPGRLFSYHYTLTSRSSAEKDIAHFFGQIVASLKSTVCAGTRNRILFRYGITVSYIYNGKDGLPIGSAEFLPNSCLRIPANVTAHSGLS